MENVFQYIYDYALFLIFAGSLIAFAVAWISMALKHRADQEIAKRMRVEKKLRIRSKELEKEKEKTKHESEQLNAIISSIGEGILVFDVDLKVILMNQAAGILLRVAPAAAMRRNVVEVLRFFKGEQDFFAANRLIKTVIKRANIIHIKLSDDFYYQNKEGVVVPVAMIMASLLQGGKVAGAIIVFRDISEEKAIDTAKSEFVSLVSHQMNTPLSIIKFYTEMLLAGDAGEMNTKQRQHIDEIDRANHRMLDLVRALLNVSKIELGMFVIEPEVVDVGAVADSVLEDFRPQIKNKKLVVEKKYASELANVNTDPRLLRIVFQNLFSNAIKYTYQKGKVGIETELQETNLFVKVSDSGCGIPKNQQFKIFTKLFRADNAKEKDPNGTGLGLYIVKSIVEQCGGKIWFESVENKGSTFYVVIPLIDSKEK